MQTLQTALPAEKWGLKVDRGQQGGTAPEVRCLKKVGKSWRPCPTTDVKQTEKVARGARRARRTLGEDTERPLQFTPSRDPFPWRKEARLSWAHRWLCGGRGRRGAGEDGEEARRSRLHPALVSRSLRVLGNAAGFWKMSVQPRDLFWERCLQTSEGPLLRFLAGPPPFVGSWAGATGRGPQGSAWGRSPQPQAWPDG